MQAPILVFLFVLYVIFVIQAKKDSELKKGKLVFWLVRFMRERPRLNELARPEGLEPPTNWFEASYSIQLSYERGKGDGVQQNCCR